MIKELDEEKRKLRLECPSTDLNVSRVELPIKLSSKISDENGSIWKIQATKISLEANFKKMASIKVNGLITVHKDKRKVLNREGLLFVHNTHNEFWNNYLNYSDVYRDLIGSDVYKKGDEKKFIEALNPVNKKLIDIARAMLFLADAIYIKPRH
ncbi:MAG: hypothetical protein V1740_03820 [Candidatus Woesearchaeota archaeon]